MDHRLQNVLLITVIAGACGWCGPADRIADARLPETKTFTTVQKLVRYLKATDTAQASHVYTVKDLTGQSAAFLLDGSIAVYVTTTRQQRIYLYRLTRHGEINLGADQNAIRVAVCSNRLGLLLLEKNKPIDHYTAPRYAPGCGNVPGNLTLENFNHSFDIKLVYITSGRNQKDLEDEIGAVLDRARLDISNPVPALTEVR